MLMAHAYEKLLQKEKLHYTACLMEMFHKLLEDWMLYRFCTIYLENCEPEVIQVFSSFLEQDLMYA